MSEEERRNDIPIVALNPGGILNWKYKAETRLRKSPLAHSVVRSTGLIAEGKGLRCCVRRRVNISCDISEVDNCSGNFSSEG